MGDPRRVAGFAMRKVSVISQWAPSLATKMLELSRCSEADQRGSLRQAGKKIKIEVQWEINLSTVFTALAY